MTAQQQPQVQVAIIGAGIAGLTAAIALQNYPHINVQVYERASELREVGATIALGPNGLTILDKLGVSAALDESVAFRNKSGHPMIYRHWQTDEVMAIDRHKGNIEHRHRTARFFRPHLQRVLLDHLDPDRLHLGRAFQSFSTSSSSASSPPSQDDQRLVIHFVDGSTAQADFVLGADGIHSAVRRAFVPASSTKWTGYTFFRSVFPRSHVQHIPGLPDEAVHYPGPSKAVFISPLAQDLYTFVASEQSDPDAAVSLNKGAVWDREVDTALLKERFSDWSPLIRQIIDATPYTNIYPNTAAQELDTWVYGNGRVTLAGDAAHAHGGAFAAGGSLAINDAWAFAASLLHYFPEPQTQSVSSVVSDQRAAQALQLYERTRKAHTDRVQSTVQNRNKGLIDDITKVQTDEELRARWRTKDDQAWIHEHDVEQAFAQAVAAESISTPLVANARL